MELKYKKADINDLDFLMQTRIEVLRAANHLPDTADMAEVKEQSFQYYQQALKAREHVACLVFEKERFVGAGGVSFYRVMPTFHNPSGNKAYIMNMYTHPDYRRRGIAMNVLDLLVREARKKGITAISLEATDMGRPLYEKYGFKQMCNEMEL